ncbi:hypothetical protein [Bdellovibrio bacteriovorus]|nr:hypothetical protein [Bdellovibrio bacteriovorus]
MGKSQHVLMSNVLPLQALLLICIGIHFPDLKTLRSIAFKSFIGFAFYILLSVSIFTEDQRLQVKAIILVPGVVFGYYMLTRVRPLLMDKLFAAKDRYYSISLPVGSLAVLLLFVPLALLVVFRYIDLASVLNRGTSGALRTIVGSTRISEVLGTVESTVIGFGLGSSSKIDLFYLHKGFHHLKSHSGIVSLVYEHGVIGFILLFGLFTFAVFSCDKKAEDEFFTQANKVQIFNAVALLFILFLSWTFLNVIYLIALPTSNYVDQAQIYTVVLIVYSLKHLIKISPHKEFIGKVST